MTAPSLIPAARAVGELSDAIRFGRSAEHPGIADTTSNARHAIAMLCTNAAPVVRAAIRARAARLGNRTVDELLDAVSAAQPYRGALTHDDPTAR